ncbi:hypothetical protein QZH41_013875 [Actinostola sp. cb2023]|nr:hypothetical protein QZH41_013875 [Actinostola sp. cb2023]
MTSQAWFTEQTGKINVSVSTICRSIIRLGFTYKKLKRIAIQRCDVKRAEYCKSIAGIPTRHICFSSLMSRQPRTKVNCKGQGDISFLTIVLD